MDTNSQSATGISTSIAVVVLVFFLSLLGSLPLLSRYHLDEGWYTNAAIQMVQSGDYVTPRYADGALRFRKPILTYWVLVTSYAALGISLFSSRLPFLLAACAILWVTYRFARSVTQDRTTGVLAAAILGSNIQFMESATKATPDILQCLFLTISSWGAVELLFNRRRESVWYALLYLGAGLGIATKGLLPFAFVAFVLLFARLVPSGDDKPVKMLHTGWLIAGLLIGLSWLAGSLLIRGPEVVSTLFEDQVGERLEGAHRLIFSNLAFYVLTPFRFFAPWIVLLVIVAAIQKDLLTSYIQRHRRLIWFVLGWLLVNIAIFSLGNLMRPRYLLPTFPFLAVLLADILRQTLRAGKPARLVSRIVQWVIVVCLGVGITLMLVGWRIDQRFTIGGLCLSALLVLLYVLTFRRQTIPVLISLSLAIMGAFATLEQCLKPVVITSPAAEITHKLLQLTPQPETIAAVGLRHSVANQIRLLSGGRIKILELKEETKQETLYQFPIMLGSRTVQQNFAASSGYESEACGVDYPPVSFGELWTALKTGERASRPEKDQRPYYLIRKQAAGSVHSRRVIS
jgi:4-amino-4-deoxy-L-arabinose transferase-like glycosyltransferase